MSRRLAHAVISVVFANYLGNAFLYVLEAGATPVRIAASLACLFTIGYLQLGVFSRPGTDLRSPGAHLALGALALLVFVPVPFFPNAWGGMPGFLAGSSLLVLRPRAVGRVRRGGAGQPRDQARVRRPSWRAGLLRGVLPRRTGWAAFGVVVASQGVLQAVWGFPTTDVVWGVKATMNHGLVPDSGRARRELAEVLQISRQALADARSVALSYRELSFDEETRSARALLSAADIEVAVRIEAGALPADVEVALATVLREGVTNLLRHSKAEHCEIVLSGEPHLITLNITNDGIPATERRSGDGSGSAT